MMIMMIMMIMIMMIMIMMMIMMTCGTTAHEGYLLVKARFDEYGCRT